MATKTIQEEVAIKIATKGYNVVDIVAEKLADIEISKRIEMVTKAIEKQDQLEKDIKKIDKTDIVTYQEGKEVHAMSKTRHDDIKKAKERFENLTKAIETALADNTNDAYTKLGEALKKVDNAGGNQEKGSS